MSDESSAGLGQALSFPIGFTMFVSGVGLGAHAVESEILLFPVAMAVTFAGPVLASKLEGADGE